MTINHPYASPIELTLPKDSTMTHQRWYGFKIVGDNVDKNIRPSFQRLDRQTRSLHYFHSYSVLDRIDHSTLSDAKPSLGLIDPECLLPSLEDSSALKHEFTVLVSR